MIYKELKMRGAAEKKTSRESELNRKKDNVEKKSNGQRMKDVVRRLNVLSVKLKKS